MLYYSIEHGQKAALFVLLYKKKKSAVVFNAVFYASLQSLLHEWMASATAVHASFSKKVHLSTNQSILATKLWYIIFKKIKISSKYLNVYLVSRTAQQVVT